MESLNLRKGLIRIYRLSRSYRHSEAVPKNRMDSQKYEILRYRSE